MVSNYLFPYPSSIFGSCSHFNLLRINYQQLAKKFHPDTNKDKAAKEKFVEIQSAYDVSVE